jgi:hypothetical protein
MSSNGDWTGQWLAEKIEGHEDVTKVELLDSNLVVVGRKDKQSVKVIAISVKDAVTADDLDRAIDNQREVNFVVNIPKDSYLSGGALSFAARRGIGIGGVGDLFRALKMEDVSEYLPPTIQFIERSLRQHDCVERFERLADMYYVIHRKRELGDIQTVFIHEYELTIDHLRAARDRYGQFQMAVKTNPNGGITTSSKEVAEELGCQVLKWGQFLGALNRK